MLLEIENKTTINVRSYAEFELRMKYEMQLYLGKDSISIKCRCSNLDLVNGFITRLKSVIQKEFIITEF